MSTTAEKDEISPELQRSLNNTLTEIGRVIVGQQYLVERLMIGLLSGGHVLVEGIPGLAKTLAIRTLAGAIQGKFARVQFTPDLLPADITGTLIYNQSAGEFSVKRGPIFANLVLADEINRAPAKVQAALLEAMQERQVTIGDETFKLPRPFLVMATQNPIEQEGTYPLPEAQLDRFLLKLKVGYPRREEEREIINRMAGGRCPEIEPSIQADQISQLRDAAAGLYMDEKLKDYIISIVFATREPAETGLKEIAPFIEWGASPRASLALADAGRAHALLRGRNYVTPDDIKAIGPDVLRHRIVLTYEALAEQVDSDALINTIFDRVEVP